MPARARGRPEPAGVRESELNDKTGAAIARSPAAVPATVSCVRFKVPIREPRNPPPPARPPPSASLPGPTPPLPPLPPLLPLPPSLLACFDTNQESSGRYFPTSQPFQTIELCCRHPDTEDDSPRPASQPAAGRRTSPRQLEKKKNELLNTSGGGRNASCGGLLSPEPPARRHSTRMLSSRAQALSARGRRYRVPSPESLTTPAFFRPAR